jgi:hypothetical protein
MSIENDLENAKKLFEAFAKNPTAEMFKAIQDLARKQPEILNKLEDKPGIVANTSTMVNALKEVNNPTAGRKGPSATAALLNNPVLAATSALAMARIIIPKIIADIKNIKAPLHIEEPKKSSSAPSPFSMRPDPYKKG